MECIVMKYGGTSIGTGKRLIHVAKVVKKIALTARPIVVLSAMSGSKKSEGTTSRCILLISLLDAANEILKKNSTRYLDIVDAVEKLHLTAAKEALTGYIDALTQLEYEIRGECSKLRSFMAAAEIIDEISPRSRDVIVSMGEKLSANIFTHVLESQGVKARYFNLDDLVIKKFDPKNLDQSFYDYLAKRLQVIVEPYVNTHVCVLTGFFGPVPGSLLTSVGRGYTDLAAALMAVGINASELQIWKEVDGIFTADPRKVPDAMKLENISPEEVAELTYYGSEVIHPFTMNQVIRASIPIRIKNTFAPEGTGTLITPTNDGRLSPAIKKPTAVTIKDNVTVLNIHSNRKSVSHGFLAQIFLILDKYGIVVDLISTSEVHVSMALGQLPCSTNLEEAINEIEKFGSVDVIAQQAILSLVGKRMRNMVGVSAKMFSSLANSNVNIEMISQGASEINISCVIKEQDAIAALCSIHHDLIQ